MFDNDKIFRIRYMRHAFPEDSSWETEAYPSIMDAFRAYAVYKRERSLGEIQMFFGYEYVDTPAIYRLLNAEKEQP